MKGHYSVVWDAVARALPERPAMITRDVTVSYREFREQAASLGSYLLNSGLKPGDPVALFLYNRPEYLVAFFACFATGLIPVPINYRYRPAEVAELLVDSQVKALMYPTSLSGTVEQSRKLVEWDIDLIEIDDGGQSLDLATTYDEITSVPGELPSEPPEHGELRLYTGGTTGRPKAVVWGTEDILEVQLYSIYTASGIQMPHNMEDVVRIAQDPATPRVATLPLAPFMHGTALFSSINTLVTGGTVIIHSSAKLDADEAIRLAMQERATRIIVAGDAIAIPTVEALERSQYSDFGSVTSMISSGMRFSDSTKRRIHQLGQVKIIDLLAATEGGPFAVCVTESVEDLPGKLQLLPGGVVLDENYVEIQNQIGAQGILAFRGTLPKGYYADQEKTAATYQEINGVRHVMPGDWVAVLEHQCVELLGRGSAVVNTGGEKVYPLEVEEALLSHPNIVDAVVFGMPDPRFGEVVSAAVVVSENATMTEEQILNHLDPLLAGYKKPRNIVQMPSLDRSPHGKVDMNSIKTYVAEQKARVSP